MSKKCNYIKLTPHILQLRYHLVQLDCQLMEQVKKGYRFKHQKAERFSQLTYRETEVLQLLAKGLNNPMIAKRLLIARSTVETHRKHLKRKLNIKSFWDLMKYALAFDLVKY